MNTIRDLIDRLGGPTRFAGIIGKNYSTASEMKRRGSIPVEYWPAVISAARDQGVDGVNNDLMVALHLAKQHRPAAQAGVEVSA